MLSFEHEFLVDLFRKDSMLAVELLRGHAGIAVDHAGSSKPRSIFRRSRRPGITPMPWSCCMTTPISR
jgi:hypothetical protein